jgi:hypothetical protein
MFIGVTALLTETYEPQEKNRVQGFNDMLIFATMAVSTSSAGGGGQRQLRRAARCHAGAGRGGLARSAATGAGITRCILVYNFLLKPPFHRGKAFKKIKVDNWLFPCLSPY